MKKIIAMTGIVVMLLSGCSFNSKNATGADADKAISWFTSTGVTVKNHESRVYTIVRDGNGWLYYCSSVEGNLEPVRDSWGLHTKDITVVGAAQSN